MYLRNFFDWMIFLIMLAMIIIANDSLLGYKFNSSKSELFVFEDKNIVEVIYTSPISDKIIGYGGPIPMAIGIDKNRKIVDIEILPNAETPDFIEQIKSSGIFDNWIGKNIDSLDNNKRIDAISGATLSSNAIINSMKITISNYLNTSVLVEFPYLKLIQLLGVVVVFVLGLLMFFYPAKMKKYRNYILVLNIIILGIWQGAMLSIAKLSAWLLNGVPDFWQWGLLAIFLASIILPMIKGRNFYCFNICPFGALQELAGKSKNKKIRLSQKISKFLSYFRLIMLFVCFLVLIAGMVANVAMLEPFSAFKPNFAPISAIIIFVISIIVSFFIPKPWCKFFCPCGAFLDLFIKK